MTGTPASHARAARRATFQARLARLAARPPRPTRGDVVAGITSGVANIPDGMASGVIAGINPVYGLYALMVNTPIAALTVSTQLMVVNTTSAMILVAADGLGDLDGEARVQAVFGIALIAGVFQVTLGLLGLGTLTRFVSNAVMTGLLTGVAVLIILGQLWDFFGYEGEGDGKLARTADLLANLGDVDLATTVVGMLAIGGMVGLMFTRLARFNLLIALGGVTALVWALGLDSVALVESLGEIPRSLPSFHPPSVRDVLAMGVAGVAVGVVGLLQAAGVAQRYPNRDGSEPDDSQDFLAQGLANVAGSFFQSMPTGGSLSGTALGVSAGAQTRWASVFMSITVIVAVLVFAGLLSLIPMAALAALLIYSASLSIKFPIIRAVQQANIRSTLAMMLTFLLTLLMPLQQAIILGVIAAGVLFVYRSSTDIRIVRLERCDGSFVESAPPARLSDGDTVLLDVYGSLFYAGAKTLSGMLPKVGDAEHALVIIRLRGLSDVGSTLLTVLEKYASNLHDHGGELMITGVDPEVKDRMLAASQFGAIRADCVFASTHVRHQSIASAEEAARVWRSAVDVAGADSPESELAASRSRGTAE